MTCSPAPLDHVITEIPGSAVGSFHLCNDQEFSEGRSWPLASLSLVDHRQVNSDLN